MPGHRARGWRRIATAVWGWPSNPQIFGSLEVDAEPILAAIERIRQDTGAKVTVTHLVTRAVALMLSGAPWFNSRLTRGRFIPRDDVSVFVIVSTGGGRDLDGVKVSGADRKRAHEIATELSERSGGLRRGEVVELERAKKLLQALPLPVLRVMLPLTAYLTTDLGLDLKALGMPREAFGGAMVTSVGMFGLAEGFVPLAPLYRVPLIVLVGEVRTKPWVVEDRVEPRRVLPLTVTIDHRWVDGAGVADLARPFTEYLADPLAYE